MKKISLIFFISTATIICNPEKAKPQKNKVIVKRPIINNNNIINGTIRAQTFFNTGSNIALLNNQNNFDQSLFLQSIVDLGATIKTPEKSKKRKVEFCLTGRVNTVLGNNKTLQVVTPSAIKIGHSITETDHTHSFDKPLFIVRETWMKIHSDSQDSFIQCGLFPKKIGLGLILGNGYRVGSPLLTNNSEIFVDQYRPGIQIGTKINSQHSIKAYCGFEQINSTSVDQQIGLTRSQELQESLNSRYIRKERATLQNTFLISLEGNVKVLERTVLQKRSVEINPFILYKYDPNQTVEFFGDAHSKLITLGASCDFTYKNFFGTIDFAVQGGQQQVKAWDRNVSLQEATKTLTHLFYEKTAGNYALSTFLPSVNDLSLSYASGATFSGFQPDGTTAQNFQNSYSRFRKSYKNNLSGLLLAADCGYNYNDRITLGGILGIISGDESPNDSTEKVMLHRNSSNWNSVRNDRNSIYFGFQGTDSLYSSRNVHSHYLLRSNRLVDGITSEPELTANSCNNLAYLGFSAKYERQLQNSNKQWYVQPNIIFMLQTHRTKFGYDPTLVDTYDPINILPTATKFAEATTRLPRLLGVELNTKFNFYDNENLSLFGSLSFFFPGAHYNKIKEISYKKQGRVIPLKNQYSGESANISGIETNEQNTVTLLNNSSMNCYLGFSLNFDSIMQFFGSKSNNHKRKKNKIIVNKFIKE